MAAPPSHTTSPHSAPPGPKAPALAALLQHAVDYAGLYPPASLPLAAAASEYALQRRGVNAWALGRFVVGLDQIPALVELPGVFDGAAWPLSVLCSDPASDLSFAERHRALVRLEAIECKAATVAEVERCASLGSRVAELYVELPWNARLDELLAAVRTLGARAKIRTGGVTRDAIPDAAVVARFLRACGDAGVPFKATAGLHHALRGEYPLTYDAGSERATMFGFLNVFVATALAMRGANEATLTRALEERDSRALRLTNDGASLCWREECFTLADLRAARAHGIGSFGSCSFAEPMAELALSGLTAE